MTGIEIPIIAAVSAKVVAAIKSNRTSVLIEETRRILNDEHLTNLLSLLYELDPDLAAENTELYTRARAIFNNLNLMKSSKYILIRYISARNAVSLATEYQKSVADNTTDAKIKQAREKATRRAQMKHSKQMKQDVWRGPAPTSHFIQDHQCTAPNDQTPQYILQTLSGAAFVYPRGTPDNPTSCCPVGSRLIMPNGFECGTIAYYNQQSAMIGLNANSSTSQTEEDDLVPVIEVRDMPYSRRGSAQAFPHSHRPRSTNIEELVEDVIRTGLQDIAESVHCIGTFRAANGSNSDAASIATTYLSFDGTDTEGGSVSDESLLDDF
ncbi:hypothetical protein C8R41DRAFT_813562 [Lentinula lateritia]|uniref:Uncharacterized protein n=1 Tax=Lentinula lateritia TaxID=40482 RepID=A0ABQ8VTR7_9AGAR|nr:hypothetical protein C8R41DRAFT_813562 [Lentinula lateritia]